MGKSMERESFCGKMTALMKDSFFKTTSTDMESTPGKMEEHMRDNGRITRWRGKDCLHGLMAEDTKEIMFQIAKKATESLHSKMGEYMKGNG